MPFKSALTLPFYVVTLILVTACASTNEPTTIENTTADGLVKLQNSDETVVLAKPGIDLTSYSKIRIVDCAIALRDSWQKDESSRMARTNHISNADLARFKLKLAELFRQEFTGVLTSNERFEVVVDSGKDTLIMRPAIFDLDIPAGEYRGISRVKRLSPTSGTGTVYLELNDSVTGELLLRIVNQKKAAWTGAYRTIDTSSDFHMFKKMLSSWSTSISARLDEFQ